MSESTPQRMRIYRGRVMHQVEASGSGWLRSKCQRPHPVKGVSGTVPRAEGRAELWSSDRRWYPDCQHCPADEQPASEPGQP
jgi:hypothetical protein